MPPEHNWQVAPNEIYRTGDASRHLGGTALPGVNDPWKCPRCGTENQTPLPQGCPVCGSGKPGFKAPITDQGLPLQVPLEYRPQNALQTSQDVIPAPIDEQDVLQAYYAWRARQAGHQTGLPALEQVWFAGVEYGRRTFLTAAAPELPMSEVSPIPDSDIGTAESRTLIAALELFIEQVLQHDPEEVTSGEWLTAQAARDLINRIQRIEKGERG